MKKKKITKKEIRRKEKKAAKRAMRELWDKLREEVKKIQSNKCYICNEEVLGARTREPERYNYLLEKIKENNLNNTKTIEINEVKKDGME